ncbi:MAG: hypothetical protein K2Y22_14150 [Candidatus Obscuribacterales bacterium]|nr:hypothetical protein [Candidatus Obscuribacterales bacterium]
MDYFPKPTPKQHVYVQKGCAGESMGDAFFAEVESRLAAISQKYKKDVYLVCLNSYESDGNKMQSSIGVYAGLLWREWTRREVQESNAIVVTLAGNQAGMSRSWAWYGSSVTIPLMTNSDKADQFLKSSTDCLVDRNCPQLYVRSVLLDVEDQFEAEAAKQREAAAQKKAQEKAAAEAAETQKQAAAKSAEEAKIQAARQSDHGGNPQYAVAIAGLEQAKDDAVKRVGEINYPLFWTVLGMVAFAAVVGIILEIKKGNS